MQAALSRSAYFDSCELLEQSSPGVTFSERPHDRCTRDLTLHILLVASINHHSDMSDDQIIGRVLVNKYLKVLF